MSHQSQGSVWICTFYGIFKMDPTKRIYGIMLLYKTMAADSNPRVENIVQTWDCTCTKANNESDHVGNLDDMNNKIESFCHACMVHLTNYFNLVYYFIRCGQQWSFKMQRKDVINGISSVR
jgi:hypothetical protein